MSPSFVWHTGREVGREEERQEALIKGKKKIVQDNHLKRSRYGFKS